MEISKLKRLTNDGLAISANKNHAIRCSDTRLGKDHALKNISFITIDLFFKVGHILMKRL